jgi:prephenate dehydrogenase
MERLAVVGTGLIGASIGLAAARGGTRVAGWDPDPDALAAAVARGAVSDPAGDLASAVAGAELVVVAAPIGVLPAQVAAVLAEAGDATVTDVGSTKSSVVGAAAGSPRFVGGHPIAGSEARGAEHANAELFQGATWFLTPTAQTDAHRHRLVHGFVGDLGSTPTRTTASSR